MNNTNHERTINYEEYFAIDATGKASLKVDPSTLPESLIIPDKVEQTNVTSLAEEMFKDNKLIKQLTLPVGVTKIPKYFCSGATNLRMIHGTANIQEICEYAFEKTRMKKATFAGLQKLHEAAFSGCAYLEAANIGLVTVIYPETFSGCALLCEVTGRAPIDFIGQQAFANTRSLKTIPSLNPNITLGAGAFFGSGIDTASFSMPEDGDDEDDVKAFPDFQDAISFWTASDLNYTPCRNRLATKLSQNNSTWKDNTFLQDNDKTYEKSAAFFAVMHIHSAITGKYYSKPHDFVNELKSDPKLTKFLLEHNWPGHFKNVASMFEALGHHTEVHGNCSNLNTQNFQALVDALKQGAYIYTEVPSLNEWMAGNYNDGHAVVLYGINNAKEVRVLDSNILHEEFREGGLDPNVDIYTYTIPFQNIVGPGSKFVIVYPREKEPVVEWTGTAATDLFDLNSKPSDYPANRVISYPVVDGKGTPDGQNGIITVHRVGDYTYRTFVPYNRAAFYMQMQGIDNDTKEYIWLEWIEFGPTRVVNNSIDGSNTTL